jgi:hypothetical protein
MEDGGGLGSLVFYIILGILAIAGSFQGKSKKQKTAPKKTVPGRPAMETRKPEARPEPAPVQRRPQYVPMDPSMEGSYEEPMAGDFSREGSYGGTMAGYFEKEGSINDTMAAAFAGEGVSALHDILPREFIHTEISDSEIGDAPEYDYNIRPGSDILEEGFDVRKALIYSVVLTRKEYSF